MKTLRKHLKPYDYLLIIFAIILSFSPLAITHFVLSDTDDDHPIAIVKIDGVEVDRYELFEGAPAVTKTYYPHNDQYNIVERIGNKIRVKEDNSPDQIAVMTGWISKPYQVSICLPHGLVIEIIGVHEEDALVLPL